MIAPSTIREIERLLDEEHHSRRKIAELSGVARSTVTAVANGERQADDYLDKIPAHRKPGEIRKCPSCSGLVRMPCRLCQTRELMADNRLQPPKPDVETPVGLNLKPEHQARYAQVRRWRREALRLGVVTKPSYEPDPP